MSIYVHQIRGVPTFSDLMAEFFAISNSTGAGTVLGENSFPTLRHSVCGNTVDANGGEDNCEHGEPCHEKSLKAAARLRAE
jgi:hypothetical protein